MKSYSDYLHDANMAARYFWANVLGCFIFASISVWAIICEAHNYGVPCAALAAVFGCMAASDRRKYQLAMRRADAVKPYTKL